jgi:CheY-like chemotaxis protein
MTRMMTVMHDDSSVPDVEAPPRASILVVDDDASIRTSLRRLLLALGYDAVSAASSVEALQKAALRVPDVIIIDLHLGIESGVDVARAIKSTAALKRIPLIAMSSASAQGEELRALFQRVLRKPFAANDMQAVLASLLSICEPRHAASCIMSKTA